MRYFRCVDGNETEISYNEALRSVTSRFKDCQMVRDMC